MQALADGLNRVADTLDWPRAPGETSAAMIELGPLFVAAGKTLRSLYGPFE